jgi:hypothetical protein
MSDDSSAHRPLPGDPARQAVDSLRGYAYQIWRTIDQWLRLKPGETLYIECAEDMDIAASGGTTAVQVKHTKRKISLTNRDALEAILHFWELQQRSSAKVRFQYLTRAAIATEQGSHFNRRPGISIWRDAARGNVESCELLRTFLLQQFASNPDFKAYLEVGASQDLIDGLFRPFEWITEEPEAQIIQEIIRRRLIAHGEQHGLRSSVSACVIDNLYSHCWEVAQKTSAEARSLAIEDFLLLFERATSVLVPISALASGMVGIAGTAGAVILAGSVRYWTEGVPPLPEPILSRPQATATAVASMSTVAPLVLAGSAGKGKTTLAKLVALAARKNCLWIDLSGRESSFAEDALAALALTLEDRGRPALVVIDDFLIEQNFPQGVWTSFTMLQRACRNSGSQLLITTKGIPRERLDARLISSGANVQQIADLSSDEVKEFLEKLGCPITLSHMWATLTLAQTGGHPKLVHVRALDLREQGWPQLTAQEFASTPTSIGAQRENERLNVTQRETGPKLDFLYLLTLLTMPFDRNCALRLGSKVEGLTDPGTALDSFLGRWIEPVIASHFRITSLLTSEANNVWPAERIQEAHGMIFDSFLEKRVIDITHTFSILMHAIRSQSHIRLVRFIAGLVDRNNAHFPQVAKELKLVVYFGSGFGNRAVHYSPHASLAFRHLQFQIASQEAPEELERIAQEWLWEIEHLPRDELSQNEEYSRLSKALWAGSVASSLESDLPPQLILDAMVGLEAIDAFGAMPSLLPSFMSESGSDDMLAIHFSFFQARCKSIDYLDRLLDALVTVPAALRSRMLTATDLPYVVDYGFIVEGAWVGEFKKEKPDWQKVIRVLERTKILAKEWGATRLGLSAAKALSIVFDEHTNSREAAIAALEDGRKLFGDAPLLDEQLANIHYRHDELDAALTIWGRSLAVQPDAPSSQVRDPFAFRKAAIAAGKTGEFDRAAELFLAGSHWAQDGGMKHTASGLIFDGAYALYRAKQLVQMCLALRRGLDELVGTPDPETEFNRYALQKLAGHVVLWIRGEVVGEEGQGVAEPVLGCCSNPDYFSGIKQLLRSPAEITIAFVIEIEHRLGMELNTRSAFTTILRASNLPTVEMSLASIDLEQIYRQRRFGDLFGALEAMRASLGRARAQHRKKQSFLEKYDGEVESQDRWKLGSEYFLICALTTHVLSGGDADRMINMWKESSEKLFSGAYADAINRLVQEIGAMSQSAGYILRSPDHDRFSRIVAAHVILTSPPTTPDQSAYAQAAYITWLSVFDVKIALQEVLPIFSAAFARSWAHHLSQRSLLINPRLTVPDIQSALACQPDGAGKIRQILHAASAATGVRVLSEPLAWLQHIEVVQKKLGAEIGR